MRYKVQFIIEGDYLADNTKLNKSNLKIFLMHDLDMKKGNNYFGNRDIDTIITKLKIEESGGRIK